MNFLVLFVFCGCLGCQIKFGGLFCFRGLAVFVLFIGFKLHSVWYVTHMAFGVLRRVSVGMISMSC